jgi:hypothetical protein
MKYKFANEWLKRRDKESAGEWSERMHRVDNLEPYFFLKFEKGIVRKIRYLLLIIVYSLIYGK